MSNEEPSGADRRRHPRYELLAQVRVKGTQSDLVTVSYTHLTLPTIYSV